MRTWPRWPPLSLAAANRSALKSFAHLRRRRTMVGGIFDVMHDTKFSGTMPARRLERHTRSHLSPSSTAPRSRLPPPVQGLPSPSLRARAPPFGVLNDPRPASLRVPALAAATENGTTSKESARLTTRHGGPRITMASVGSRRTRPRFSAPFTVSVRQRTKSSKAKSSFQP